MPEGPIAPVTRELADEMPIAIEFNGIGYAVLMATPADIEELVLGFALAERLIGREDALLDVDVHATEQGIIARATLPEGRTEALLSRVRHRASESSCGICGLENLDQAIRPLPSVTASSMSDSQAVFRALGDLKEHQPLNARTGAAHAAALVASDGTIRLAREDVGRHNAFDKLIGAMWQRGWAWDGGFALLIRIGGEGRAGGLPLAGDDFSADTPCRRKGGGGGACSGGAGALRFHPVVRGRCAGSG